MAPHAGLERRVLAALEAAPPRIPVVLGGCGSGRTTPLHALVDRLGRDECQYIDVERAASTPERFLHAVVASTPFAWRRRDRRAAHRARGLRPHAGVFDPRARDRRSPGHVPARRSARAAHVRELPRPASRPARAAAGARRERQPLRAHLALRRARASAAARRHGALRGDSPAGALPDRSRRHAAADGRRAGRGSRVPQPHDPGARRWPRGVRARDQRSDRGHERTRRRSDLRAHRAAHLRRRAHRLVRLSLRAAAAPRPRLRRAQGDSRNPRRRRAAHADRDRASACIARRARRRTTCPGSRTSTWSSRARSATASPTRCSASGCGCTAGRSRPASTKSRARSRATRRHACRTAASRRWRSPAPAPANARAGASSRSTEDRSPLRISTICDRRAPRARARAASCSASFFVRPTPWAITSPPTRTSTWNSFR